MRLLSPKPISCQELVELCTAYIEDALPRRERRRFEAHIGDCPHCTAYLDQFRATIAATGSITEEQIAPEAREELLAVFREWKTAR